jgi:hypothetical protein
MFWVDILWLAVRLACMEDVKFIGSFSLEPEVNSAELKIRCFLVCFSALLCKNHAAPLHYVVSFWQCEKKCTRILHCHFQRHYIASVLWRAEKVNLYQCLSTTSWIYMYEWAQRGGGGSNGDQAIHLFIVSTWYSYVISSTLLSLCFSEWNFHCFLIDPVITLDAEEEKVSCVQ